MSEYLLFQSLISRLSYLIYQNQLTKKLNNSCLLILDGLTAMKIKKMDLIEQQKQL